MTTIIQRRGRGGLFRIATALIALVFVAAACGGDGNDAQEVSGEPGTLLFGYSTGPTSLDPVLSTTGGDRIFLFPVYDTLIRLDNAGEVGPGLADEWEFAEDSRSLEMTLRSGVTFQDGEPFNAEAVKANLDRAMEDERSTLKADLAAVVGVEVVDDMVVRLDLAEGGAGILRVLGDRAGMMASPAAFETLNESPVGAGPYSFGEYRIDDRVIYEPYEEYYELDDVTLGGLEVLVIADDATRLNAARSGQIDMTFIRPFQVEEAEAAGLNVKPNLGLIWYYMGMNMDRSEFGDVRVRQALNYALNREEITSTILAGYCGASVQPVPDDRIGHASAVTVESTYPYDPERARELLAEAGLPDGFSFQAMVVQPPFFVQIAEAMQADFAEIGVEMDLNVAPIPQVNDTYFAQAGADAYVGLWLGTNDPSAMAANLYMPDGFSNPSGHSTPEIQELYAQTVSSTDDEERQAAFDELIPLAVDEAYHVGLCNVETPLVYTDDVLNVSADTPTWQWDFRGISRVAS